uniref:cytochrome P450 2D28-like n=1 Tax=Ciona intestinalis TaxID=7719 RepID=UPI000180D047|nr:cytochrome P450 2D28-like [Ciona intestinalis]|eukprot:XP_002128140.1 cytochrome P450 2D28-like [Ciona intestinalis]
MEISVQSISSIFDTILLVFIVSYLTWHFWNQRSAWAPPGPRGLPFIGAITSIRKHPEHAMMKWNQQYGPVCMVRFGFKDILLLGSYEAAHEALVKNMDLADRPSNGIAVFKGGKGILMTKFGSYHQEQRRFSLNKLREYGMGRRALEPTILLYSNELCERIEKFGSKPFYIDMEIYKAISSTICHIVFGHNVIEENEDFKEIINTLNKKSKLNVLSGILAFAPFLRFLPVFSTIHAKSVNFQQTLHALVRQEISEHEKTRDPKEPRDYIDSFLNEMDKAKSTMQESETTQTTGGESIEGFRGQVDPNWKQYSSFTYEQLVAMCRDLFMAGTDTTSSTTSWIILFLCRYPEVQRKMQEEADQVLGSNGEPKMALAEKMPYTRAVIQEINRIRPNVPLSVPHYSSKDTMVMGYKIPKDTIVLTNIWGIHHDEKLWKNPYDFNPERHLDSNGKFIKSSKVIQFNIGLRSCLGQQLANMELFLVTVSIFRQFSFSFNPGDKIDMEGESVIALRPYSYRVIAEKRM